MDDKPTTLTELALTALGLLVGLPLVFWLGYGETSIGFALGLAAFLSVLALGVWYSDRLRVRDAAAPSSDKSAPPVAAPDLGRLSMLMGVVWVLCIPFGPFVGWAATEMLTSDNWRVVVGLRALVCVVLPLVCVLPMLRIIRRPNLLSAGAFLLIGTAIPVAVGAGSAYDIIAGPVVQDVNVTDIRGTGFRTGLGTTVQIDKDVVELADGRRLRPAEDVKKSLEYGPIRLTILRGMGRIITPPTGATT